MSLYESFDLSPGFRVIEAGAGSGKTFTLIELVKRLANGEGATPSRDIRRIALVTFTKAAALEMRQRLRSELEKHGMSDALQRMGGMHISTIHSFCHLILRNHAPLAGFQRVADTAEGSRDLAKHLAADWWRGYMRALPKAGATDHIDLVEAEHATRWLLANPRCRVSERLEAAGLPKFKASRPGFGGLAGITRDDLIRKTLECLEDGEPAAGGKTRGELLIELVQKDFDACLVDEAQDTDRQQWDIFQKIFDPAERKLLVMVGDPKQAIYGFRGADIASYIDAKRRAVVATGPGAVSTLSSNLRSKANLIAAFNQVFRAHPAFFGGKITCAEILLPDAKATPTQHADCQRDHIQPPIRVVEVDSDDSSQVAREVARLLAELSQGRDGEANLAVLVRNNRDAIPIHRALVARNIPAALAVRMSVFASDIAKPLLLLLRAILQPGDADIRKTVLLLRPSLVGLDGDANDAYDAHGESIGAWLRDLRKTWKDRGIGACWEQMGTTAPDGLQPIRVALARSTLPQRHLADFNHIGELLTRLASSRHLTMEGLVNAMSLRTDGANPDSEEDQEDEQLRAETAKPQVIVRSIHTAKGLEYDGVLIPHFGRKREVKVNEGNLLRIDGEDPRIVTSSSGDADLVPLVRQTREEDARLLYVALTRAKRRIVLLWEPENGKAKAAAQSSGFPEVLSAAGAGGTAAEFVKGLDDCAELAQPACKDDSDIRAALDCLAAPKMIVAETHEGGEEALNSLAKQAGYRHTTASFTSLTEKPVGKGLGRGKNGAKARPFEAFVGGKKAKGGGTSLHRLLELLDFGRAATDAGYVRAVAERELRLSGLFLGDPKMFKEQLDLVCEEIPLWLMRKTSSGFAFRDVSLADRMAEVRFGMRLRFDGDKADRLRTSIRGEYAGKQNAEGVDLSPLAETQLSDDTIEGMLTGSIDLAIRAGQDGRIYIVDWKSNRIPEEVGGYGGYGLVRAMAHSSYHLQYTLYAAALRLHLQACHHKWDPAQFGGVHYIFLRAFGREGQGGDFFHRPTDRHLDDVTRILTND